MCHDDKLDFVIPVLYLCNTRACDASSMTFRVMMEAGILEAAWVSLAVPVATPPQQQVDDWSVWVQKTERFTDTPEEISKKIRFKRLHFSLTHCDQELEHVNEKI